ncbi:MAG: thioredoxin [Clostridia bacterium]|nr:thioredoxin [Clostridia bacterium]
MVRHIDEKEFESEVLGSKSVVLVDFYATWCPPCKLIAPVLDEISESRANFNIVKINVDENPSISMQYNVESIPTLLFFKNGKIVDKLIGYNPKEKVEKILLSHID